MGKIRRRLSRGISFGSSPPWKTFHDKSVLHSLDERSRPRRQLEEPRNHRAIPRYCFVNLQILDVGVRFICPDVEIAHVTSRAEWSTQRGRNCRLSGNSAFGSSSRIRTSGVLQPFTTRRSSPEPTNVYPLCFTGKKSRRIGQMPHNPPHR
jgi:hypothetical protein